jgi:hypothetical protein
MRTTTLFGAAAVLALGSGQALAGSSAGYVGAAYLNSETEIGGAEVEGDGWGADGAAAFELSPDMGLQLGALFVDDDDSDENAFSLNGHLNLRNDKRLIGVFANLTDADDETLWAFGAEGELYMSDLTLAGAVSYSSEDEDEAWGLDGEARYFVTSNFRLEGELGFANFEGGGGGDDSAVSLGAGAEYQFEQTPFSVFAGYQHAEFDEADLSTDAFTIGGRFNFGGSLLDRDRKGASLPGLSSFTGALGV